MEEEEEGKAIRRLKKVNMSKGPFDEVFIGSFLDFTDIISYNIYFILLISKINSRNFHIHFNIFFIWETMSSQLTFSVLTLFFPLSKTCSTFSSFFFYHILFLHLQVCQFYHLQLKSYPFPLQQIQLTFYHLISFAICWDGKFEDIFCEKKFQWFWIF